MNSERSVILATAGQRIMAAALILPISCPKIASAVARAAGRLHVSASVASARRAVDLDPRDTGDDPIRLHRVEGQHLRAVDAPDALAVSAETGLCGQEPVFPVTPVSRRSARVKSGLIVHLVRTARNAADLVAGAERARGGRGGQSLRLRHANTVARGGTPATVPTARHSRCG